MKTFTDVRDETHGLTEEITKIEREIDERVAALYGVFTQLSKRPQKNTLLLRIPKLQTSHHIRDPTKIIQLHFRKWVRMKVHHLVADFPNFNHLRDKCLSGKIVANRLPIRWLLQELDVLAKS